MTPTGARIESEAAPESDAVAAAMAAELAQLRAQVEALSEQLAEAERRADIDVLTPLLNRRAFMREVQRAIAVARRHDIPASVIFFDLDGFKAINDRYGHAAGDAALVAVAQRLQHDVRESDVVGRLGGDEFAILLQHADRDAATERNCPARGVDDIGAITPIEREHVVQSRCPDGVVAGATEIHHRRIVTGSDSVVARTAVHDCGIREYRYPIVAGQRMNHRLFGIGHQPVGAVCG